MWQIFIYHHLLCNHYPCDATPFQMWCSVQRQVQQLLHFVALVAQKNVVRLQQSELRQ
jgi:hypothetical protein